MNKIHSASSTYLNKKNGNLYTIISEATDCTNSRDGLDVVIYMRKGDCMNVFVREATEFFDKFERVDDHE